MDHAVIGGVVAVVVFAMLCLLIILGRYFARHKGKRALWAAGGLGSPVFWDFGKLPWLGSLVDVATHSVQFLKPRENKPEILAATD